MATSLELRSIQRESVRHRGAEFVALRGTFSTTMNKVLEILKERWNYPDNASSIKYPKNNDYSGNSLEIRRSGRNGWFLQIDNPREALQFRLRRGLPIQRIRIGGEIKTYAPKSSRAQVELMREGLGHAERLLSKYSSPGPR